MKLTIEQLRSLLVLEATKISASPEYMIKEKVRQELQDLIALHVSSGDITDQNALEQFIKSVDTSMTALRMIPFEVWKKLSSKKSKK